MSICVSIALLGIGVCIAHLGFAQVLYYDYLFKCWIYFVLAQVLDSLYLFKHSSQGELRSANEKKISPGALRAGAFQVRYATDPGFVQLV